MTFTPADFCIGESGIWFYSLMWENGKEAEPVAFLDENIIETEPLPRRRKIMSKARQIYEDLGVVPVINASGYQTVIGGSRVGTEVQAAMDIANRYFADMEELLKKTGAIIADTLGAEAAMVTPGCAAALSS